MNCHGQFGNLSSIDFLFVVDTYYQFGLEEDKINLFFYLMKCGYLYWELGVCACLCYLLFMVAFQKLDLVYEISVTINTLLKIFCITLASLVCSKLVKSIDFQICFDSLISFMCIIIVTHTLYMEVILPVCDDHNIMDAILPDITLFMI